ncbi:hypothetical protein AbHV_ORF74 [Abalone herpesvirus Victoria/AUS/2009]|uniref:Uncharacterized protein n=1 Tax=Abalone herpesvirus (isolate Abalone/Australia/Victoria/2009) TaxID=1241371 RepID=K4JV75_ABHV|nr:hypothetical protein AbHV_ORF74 [Abalone herpesvirus Victoria/AUS/2009]AFU90086.1 hypothetical protein AbHV_ORF74 [Abalone herpesvirus Victoria/AUS/2009]
MLGSCLGYENGFRLHAVVVRSACLWRRRRCCLFFHRCRLFDHGFFSAGWGRLRSALNHNALDDLLLYRLGLRFGNFITVLVDINDLGFWGGRRRRWWCLLVNNSRLLLLNWLSLLLHVLRRLLHVLFIVLTGVHGLSVLLLLVKVRIGALRFGGIAFVPRFVNALNTPLVLNIVILIVSAARSLHLSFWLKIFFLFFLSYG